MKIHYDKNSGKLIVPPGMAIRLQRRTTCWKGEDELAKYVPERKTHMYALDPRKWQGTFWSLTNKDPEKIVFYKPVAVPIVPGTLVADMALANIFFRTKDPAAALAYKDRVRRIEEADIAAYRYPELLIPR